MSTRVRLGAGAVALAVGLAAAPTGAAPVILEGRVRDPKGAPVAGAMVTFSAGAPVYAQSVFTDDAGRFRAAPAAEPTAQAPLQVRVRRAGWKDLTAPAQPRRSLDLVLERERDPAALAAQLPANHWYKLALDRIPDPMEREEFVRQCTYCHQQGSLATRQPRDEEVWRKLLALMGRMGAMLSRDLREKLPGILNAAYDPASAVPALTAGLREAGPPPLPAEVRRSLIEEWELGGAASMQHDLMVHPDGRIYSVDMAQDRLYRLDPRVPGGGRESFEIPQGDLPLGGVLASVDAPPPPGSNSRVGPHSLQPAPDGSIWITLALGNQLARFDPASRAWTIHEIEAGIYPHTLRFDRRGRIWFTLAASNHVGMFDPATGEQLQIRLPARTWTQAAILRAMPQLLWLGRRVDLRSAAADGDGIQLPVPYGIDVAPDGSVWFSQLNEHRIGRIDPESLALEMLDTPFTAPRRLRFDSLGRLWIPAFSASLLARFDPATREFRSFELPIEPRGSETPYALNVERRSNAVWICGTNSDTLMRFDPESERFTVYPLPTRVTYTREIDFDSEGRAWTSNSNSPAWHIEGGLPRVLRLDPDGAKRLPAKVARARSAR